MSKTAKTISHIVILITLTVILFPAVSTAQVLGGFFNQKGEQRKLLLQQIAALRTYSGYLKKGYTTIKDGAAMIGDIKSGEFSLHKDYFASLEAVSPAVSTDGKARSIPKLEERMHLLRQQILTASLHSAVITPNERNRMKQALDGMDRDALIRTDEYRLATESGQAALTDDARFSKINQLYTSVRNAYGQHIRLCKELTALIHIREQTARDSRASKTLHGLP